MSLKLTRTADELVSQFRSLSTRQDVAHLLDVDVANLNYHLYISPIGSRYTVFRIPKKSGAAREITAPISAIKFIQQKLNQVLQHVYKRRPGVHGFINDYSVVTNARRHVRRQWILNIDLESFFPSITFPRIRGLFIAKPYSLDPAAATVLAQICCHHDRLPQGAPTSPIVSNMICSTLDNELNRLARKHKCRYTRYADDITFSSDADQFPVAVAQKAAHQSVKLGEELLNIVHANGFRENPDKISLRRNNVRQEVTGLTVNKQLNVRRSYLRQIRTMLHE